MIRALFRLALIIGAGFCTMAGFMSAWDLHLALTFAYLALTAFFLPWYKDPKAKEVVAGVLITIGLCLGLTILVREATYHWLYWFALAGALAFLVWVWRMGNQALKAKAEKEEAGWPVGPAGRKWR